MPTVADADAHEESVAPAVWRLLANILLVAALTQLMLRSLAWQL